MKCSGWLLSLSICLFYAYPTSASCVSYLLPPDQTFFKERPRPMLLSFAHGVRPNLNVPPSRQAFEFYLRLFYGLEMAFDWDAPYFKQAENAEKINLARMELLLPTHMAAESFPTVWARYWDSFVLHSHKMQGILLAMDPKQSIAVLTDILGPPEQWPSELQQLATRPLLPEGEFSFFTYVALAERWLKELLDLREAWAETGKRTDRLEIFIFKLIESVGFFRHVRPQDVKEAYPAKQYLLYRQAQQTALEFISAALPNGEFNSLPELAKSWQSSTHFPIFPEKKLAGWRRVILRPLAPEEAFFAYLAGKEEFQKHQWPQGEVKHDAKGNVAALDPAAQFLMLTDVNGNSRGLLKFLVGSANSLKTTAEHAASPIAILDQVHLIKGEELLTVLAAAAKAWQDYGITMVLGENFLEDQDFSSFALRKIIKIYLERFITPPKWNNFKPLARDVAAKFKDQRLDEYQGQSLFTFPQEEQGDFVVASGQREYFSWQDKFPTRRQDFGENLRMPNSSIERDWLRYIDHLRRFAFAYPFEGEEVQTFILDIVRRQDLSFKVRFSMLQNFYPELQEHYLLLSLTIFSDPQEQLAILRDFVGQKSGGFFIAQKWQKYYSKDRPHGPDDPAKILGLVLSKIRTLDVKLDEVFWRDFVDGLTVTDSKVFNRSFLIKGLLQVTEMQGLDHASFMHIIQSTLQRYIY